MAISRVLVLLLFIMVTVHAGKHTDPRKVKPIPPKSDIIGDGNCLYRAVAQYLYDSQENHRNVRQDILNLMTENEHVYRRFIVHDHNGDYESFLSNGNSGALQVVRARSDQGVERWLHLAHSASHYDIISDSSREGAVEPQNAVDLHDIYSLNTPEHDKIIPDDEVTKINNPFLPEDAVDNICYGLQDVSFSEKKEDFQDIRGKKEIRKTLLELENKQTDEKIAESERELSSLCRTTQNLDLRTLPPVENVGPLDVVVDVGDKEATKDEEPIPTNEVLCSEEEDSLETEDIQPDKKSYDRVQIKSLPHLQQLIRDGQVRYGSHFRVRRHRFGFEYYHHFLTVDASDQNMTVFHLTMVPVLNIRCVLTNIDYARPNGTLLDFNSGVELLYKFKIHEKEAIELRIQELLSLDFIGYSLTAPDKMYCASVISYVLTGEKDHSEVCDFINYYNISAYFIIWLIQLSCLGILYIQYGKIVHFKLKGKMINMFEIAQLQVTDLMHSLFGFIDNCMSNPAVNLLIILMKKVLNKDKEKKD